MLLSRTLGAVLAALPLLAQTFDVASVKPSPADERMALTIQPGGRLVAHSFSLKALIAIACHRPPFQMSGGDGWISDDRWSIEAKAEEVTQIPAWAPPYLPEVIAVRVRSLLEDRFSLRTHREMREIKAYTLTVDKNGSKLAAAAVPSNPPAIAAGPGIINASAVTMDQVLTYLNRILDLPVIDKTNLAGCYDFKLRFAPESTHPLASLPPPETGDPSIFAALQEQLGLNLKSSKETVEVLVIDSARRPGEN